MHISQLADEFVANCDDWVKEGDMVRSDAIDADDHHNPRTLAFFRVFRISHGILMRDLFSNVHHNKPQMWHRLFP